MKDGFSNGSAVGPLAQRLLSCNMQVKGMKTNAVLRKDEWIHYDAAVVKIAQARLIGVADLMSRGLMLTLNNGLGKMVLQYEDSSDIEAAQVSMAGVTKGQNDRQEYELRSMPLPITHKDFQINIRALNASRTLGETLDTAMAERAARKVAESLESALFTGLSTFTYGGGTIYGYMDAPNRNTGSLTANWDDSASNGETILTDVRAMKQASIDAMHYGPYMVYVPTNYETVLDDDFKSNSDKTTRQRLREISGIIDVKVADTLTDDNVLLVQMSNDVVRMVEGLPVNTVEWDTEGGMISHFKVMTINVPQIRNDQDGNSGVTHFS